MTAATITLALVVFTALAFDFTNGFHDTANAMATSIATGALRPKVAVALSAVLNLVGAFLSVEVALTVTNAVIKIQDKSGAPKAQYLANGGQALLLIVLAGLCGGIIWNLLTWLLASPHRVRWSPPTVQSSQRNKRAAISPNTTANPSSTTIGTSAALGPSPRTITSSIPVLSCPSGRNFETV